MVSHFNDIFSDEFKLAGFQLIYLVHLTRSSASSCDEPKTFHVLINSSFTQVFLEMYPFCPGLVYFIHLVKLEL